MIGKRAFMRTLLSYVSLMVLCVFFITPLVWMISTALKESSQVIAFPPIWIPHPVKWDNFIMAVVEIPYFLYLKNTLILVTFSILGSVISCPIIAYGFSRIRWPGRNFLLVLVILSMMIPLPATLIPKFLIFAKLGWIDTFKPLIVPIFLGSPFYIFLLRQFFMVIPEELSDAARVDGASEVYIFSRIILPLSKAALAVVVLFQFLASWNDFFLPLVYLTNPTKFPLALGLQDYRTTLTGGESWMNWNLFMAASTITVIPTIIIFFVGQRYFIQGIHLTGIKE